jgi:glycosyltransferase involved in cell wall biosynthesis
MILIFEMSWTGTTHAASNSSTVQIVARAFPDQEVRVHADPTHLRELQGDPALTAHPNVTFVPIAISPLFPGSPANVAWGRFRQEFQTVRDALLAMPRGEPCLVFLMSTTATGPFAASWAVRMSGRRAAVQVGYHGNLNDATSWRPRHPIRRAFDTRSALTARYPAPVRFLVLEEGIRVALQRLFPRAAARTDVLPLPVNTAELVGQASVELSGPIRIGFVGLGTAAKGMDVFLEIARRARGRWGDRVEFVHIGRAGRDTDLSAYEALAHPPALEHLPREDFRARMSGLHYVFLPFRRGYYDLSASGALLDAVTWLKPVITSRVPLTEQFFTDYGEIGFLCEDEAALEATVDAVVAAPDPTSYRMQVEGMRRAAAAREVATLALRYQEVLRTGFPGLLRPAVPVPRSAPPPSIRPA